jgi:hypothetical protein
MSAIRIGDIGVRFQLQLEPEDGWGVLDVSGATLLHLIFRKPSGTVVTQIATMSTDGTDGLIEWTSESVMDLDESGPWVWQAYVILDTEHAFHTSLLGFDVMTNFG